MTSSLTRKPSDPPGASDTTGPIGLVGSSRPVGAVGVSRPVDTSGPSGFTPEALAELKSRAKVGAPQPLPKRPWDGLDPTAPADSSRSVRMNAYDRALLAYLAGFEGGSVQKVLIKLVRAAALAEIKKREG